MTKSLPIAHPARPWHKGSAEFSTLWHGALDNARRAIEAVGVDLSFGYNRADFGHGFYLTSIRHQAEQWAWKKFARAKLTGPAPVVMRFDLPRMALASLDSLHFVRGSFAAIEYWSFVQHCRQNGSGSPIDHVRPNNQWYDMVSGPVSMFWRQRVGMPDSDQFSFHTPAAAHLIREAIDNGHYKFFPVP